MSLKSSPAIHFPFRRFLDRFYNLRLALLGYVLIPVLLVIVMGGSYTLRSLEKQVEARMQEDIELIARAIRLPLSYALEQNRFGSIEQALASAFRIDRVYGAYVYDEDGSQIASSGTPKARVQTREAAELAAGGNRQGEFGRAGSEEVYSYFVPLTDSGGRINGLLQVTRRGSDFTDYLASVRSQALVIFVGISALLIMFVLLGHHRAVGRHLHNIKQRMVHMDIGDLEQRIVVKGPSEIRVLADGINAMLDRIKRSRTELDHRRKRESELQARLQQSEKLAAVGQLAAGVAHQLGTPLSTIDGKSQQLLRLSDMPVSQRQAIRQIRTEANRMEWIIRQLLDFGRNNPLQKQTIDCSVLIRTSIDQLEDVIQKRKIIVETRPASIPVCVDIDPIRIEQAITNLLKNAIQACRNRVLISWYREQDEVIIAIEDDGPGIQNGQTGALFEPFYTTKDIGDGTGLGLSVAHAAVADHEGVIDVSRSGTLGGAVFRIILQQYS